MRQSQSNPMRENSSFAKMSRCTSKWFCIGACLRGENSLSIRRPRQTQGGARQGIRQAKTSKFSRTSSKSSGSGSSSGSSESAAAAAASADGVSLSGIHVFAAASRQLGFSSSSSRSSSSSDSRTRSSFRAMVFPRPAEPRGCVFVQWQQQQPIFCKFSAFFLGFQT